MPVPAADMLRAPMEGTFVLFSGPVNYSATPNVMMAIRGLRADELWGSAVQTDRLGVVLARNFMMQLGRTPGKFDRVVAADGAYTVMEWKPAPAVGEPVWFRLILRGGKQ